MRYAIYYTPASGSELHRLGSSWLGRDVFGHPVERQPEDIAEFAVEPARYGFHATLKPPFALADGGARDDLGIAVAVLASGHRGIAVPALTLRVLDGFLALMPDPCPGALHALAADCVRDLDRFRCATSQAELERRRAAGLSHRQEENLTAWGYPYVLDEFRFHMTLTRCLNGNEQRTASERALQHFAPVLGRPVMIDAVTIFRETTDRSPFVAEERVSLMAAPAARLAS